MAASANEVRLLGFWPSPYAIRARIALNIKSVEYEVQEENIFVSKSDLLLQSNPMYKKIPVLIHGGRPICESAIIVQYIDEAWTGPSILPLDPYDRATARFWTAYMDDKWFPSVRAFFLSDSEEARNAGMEAVTQGPALFEEAFTKCSKGDKFFGGERIGFLDISLGCFLAWIRVVEKVFDLSLIHESKTPKLFEWACRFSADDAVKDVLPETDKLLEFSKYLLSAVKGDSGKLS